MITHQLIETLTIIASLSTIGLIIINQPQTGDTFGTKGGIMQTRRGFEKQLHTMTIVSSVVLMLLVLAGQVVR